MAEAATLRSSIPALGGMVGHKRQHFVPQCYLKAWCDPNTPTGQEPYVWRFSKDGSAVRPKAPENIFHETDLYTVPRPDGGRDLRLEHGLSQLESAFVAIRDNRLARLQPIPPTQRALLCAFISAAHARTPTARDHIAGVFGEMFSMMNRAMEWWQTATPEQRRVIPRPGLTSDSGNTLSYEDVKKIVEQPMQTTLRARIAADAKLLPQLDLLVLCCDTDSAFITSDNPCVWSDPEGYKRPPMLQGPALMYESIEITLPVSPRQMILLNRRGVSGYADIPPGAVDELNRRTRFYCSEHFVSNTNTTKPIWFDPGIEPEDSWRKLNP